MLYIALSLLVGSGITRAEEEQTGKDVGYSGWFWNVVLWPFLLGECLYTISKPKAKKEKSPKA